MEMLFQELGDTRWDVLAFSETWREAAEEIWESEHGHTWYGSGGTKQTRGVGFLLHRRWKHLRFKPLTERACVLDIEMPARTLRIINTYMPHSDYSDLEVDAVYAMLEIELEQARRRRYLCTCVGDFNAEVGPRCERDDPLIIGENPMPKRNDRGDWLVKWCTAHDLSILNTYAGDDAASSWTYCNAECFKQLDYALFDKAGFDSVVKCYVMQDVDIGSDHRPVFMSLRARASRKRKSRRRSARADLDPKKYKLVIEEKLSNLPSDYDCTATRAESIEHAMTEAAKEATPKAENTDQNATSALDDEIQALIQQRRAIRDEVGLCRQERKLQRTEISKRLKKLIRRKLDERREHRISKVLADFKGLKELANMSKPQKKTQIAAIKDGQGCVKHDRAEIAEVFAEFYETLYACRGGDTDGMGMRQAGRLDPIDLFTAGEFRRALRTMKSGKARDRSGVIAEMIKMGGSLLHDSILDLFNDVLKGGAEPPSSWKHTRLVVIFKKGDSQLPSNYRPIAILPILYKLFSRMLCNRIQGTLLQSQTVDQAAYRHGFSTEDHLLALTLVTEQCQEWNVDLWFGLVDFEKAFDTVNHDTLWKVLEDQNVEPKYIRLLRKLYSDQIGSVRAGEESRTFTLGRGVKQGDPISALLFIAVMEACFKTLKAKWNTADKRRVGHYLGIVVDDPADPLTNLRFADDVLLLAHSRRDITRMISDLAIEAEKYGLKLHMGKTNILTMATDVPRQALINGEAVKILKGGERYLGRKLALDEYHETEFRNRLSAGWASFMKNKDILCRKAYSLRHRMRLFEATVTPAVLYGSAAWTLTKDMENDLVTARRRMFRMMLAARRAPDEEWTDYIKRTTKFCEEYAAKLGYESWVIQFRRRKWRFAGRASRQVDRRWSTRLLWWRPWFRIVAARSVGR